MRTGPSVECQGCQLPILLASAVCEGAQRVLTCPLCGHAHLWVVVDDDVSASERHGGSRKSLGSSVE